jgi:nucleobase:cation symporter-1, NCS1 family
VWLGFLGASIASAGVTNDPADFVSAAFGAFSIPVLFLVMHGPVATNILNLYSATLAALSLDVKAARWKVSVVVSIVGVGVLVWFIQSANWAEKFDQWLASVVLWISAWAGVMVVDYLVIRRGTIDVPALYARAEDSIYGDVNWAAVIGMLAGVVAGWAWGYGLTGFLQGPIAKATHNVDLSWLTGFGVAAILYYVLRPFFVKETAVQAAPTV